MKTQDLRAGMGFAEWLAMNFPAFPLSMAFAYVNAQDPVAAIVVIVVLIIFLIVGAVMYFLPAVIAIFRGHYNWDAIAVVNLFFGWTFVGWVVALVGRS